MDKREAYLQRVGLSAFPRATEEGLRELHTAQIFSVPFENLSVLLGDPVSLDLDSLFAKLVAQKRGGYCFELNGLFSWALTESGFNFRTHLARVKAQNPEPGPLTHQLSLVEIAGRTWLADVGFGGPSIRYPMPFEEGRVEVQEGERFRLARDPDHGHVLEQEQDDGTWMKLYFFQRSRVLPADIAMGNHFTSTFEGSIFRKWFMLSRPFPGGKNTMFARNLKRRRGGETQPDRIADARQLGEVLEKDFGLRLDSTRHERLAAVLARME